MIKVVIISEISEYTFPITSSENQRLKIVYI